VEVGAIEPALAPWEADAWKPRVLSAKDEAQQQRVEQQRKRKRNRQSVTVGLQSLEVERWLPGEIHLDA
jgi:hypothetical protein